MGGAVSLESDSDRGEVIDDFSGRYIGSVPVKAAVGNDVAEMAVARLAELGGKEHAVRVVVTTMGLYVVEKGSGDTLKEVAINDVSFVAEHSQYNGIVMFFENYSKLRLILCHAFKMSSKASQLPLAINDAFTVLGAIETDGSDADFVRASPEPTGGDPGKVIAMRKSKTATASRRAKARSRGYDNATELAALAAAANAKVDKGKALLALDSCIYHGSAPVSNSKGDATLDEAKPRIERTVNGTAAAALPCNVVVYERFLVVLDPGSESVAMIPRIADITYAKLSPSEKDLWFIVHSSRLDTMECHHLTIPAVKTGQPSFRQVIDMAQSAIHASQTGAAKAAAAAVSGSGPMAATSSAEAFAVIGNFEASFVDRVWVKARDGQPIADAAVRTVLARKPVLKQVFIQVSVEGIKVMDSLSYEKQEFVLDHVTFTAVVEELYFTMFTDRCQGSGMCAVDVYKCAGERAFDVANAIGDAFKLSDAVAKEDPFKPSSSGGERSPAPATLSKKQVLRSDLKALKPIGAGQFGQVYLTEQSVAAGSGDGGGGLIKRAVKLLRNGCSEGDRDEFLREAEAMLDMEHPQVVGLVGVVVQEAPWLLVLSYHQYGDLKSLLDVCRSNEIALRLVEQLVFCVQICKGMEYIASKRYIHMDLAARNVLAGADNSCRIADFGLSRRLPPGKDCWRPRQVMKVSPKWAAIECLDERMFSVESDVWATGVTMWEVMSCGLAPYGDLKTSQVQARVRDGHRVALPAGCPRPIYDIIISCCRGDRGSRPPFKDLVAELGLYHRNESVKETTRDVGQLFKSAGK